MQTENPRQQNKMAAAKPENMSSDIPNRLIDTKEGKTYKRMRFFGNGGFAKCYEIIDVDTEEVFACKILSKKLMINHSLRKELTTQEIAIHRTLSHPNVVMFHSSFEDVQNIYIVLELCKKRSMQDLQNRRRSIKDFECRYYIFQIIRGVEYLHNNRIIHRDLKLANIFLDVLLHVKIGDFGLATRIEYEGELKQTVCGTPSYMAPEMLTQNGHSFGVDIWALGCIMYTLLVGQPPFETKILKDMYAKIIECEFRVPCYVRKTAADMVNAMLQKNPESRPAIGHLLNFEFMAPRIDSNNTSKDAVDGKPLMEIKEQVRRPDYRSDIMSLYQQVSNLINGNPRILKGNLGNENTDSAAQPTFWISKYYSDNYGFGYQLCNDAIGAVFSDTTQLILLPNQIDVHFIDKDGQESYMTTVEYCKTLYNGMKRLSYFKRHMANQLKAGANNVNIESVRSSPMPHLHSWLSTESALVMHLTNGSVQLNFVDHTKLVLCPRKSAIIFIDGEKNFRTYRFSTIGEKGVPKDLFKKIRCAQEILKEMLDKNK